MNNIQIEQVVSTIETLGAASVERLAACLEGCLDSIGQLNSILAALECAGRVEANSFGMYYLTDREEARRAA